jgi:hypothetical protein
MDYFSKCLQDIDRLNDELVQLASPVLSKKAILVRRLEIAAIKRMNEIVDSAFDIDPQLRDSQYAFDIEHDDDSNRWFAYFNNLRVSYSESEQIFEWREPIPDNLSKLYDYEKNALAIQIYIIGNYISPDPICSKFYDTSKITHPRFKLLHSPWWYSQTHLVSFATLKQLLRSKVRDQYDKHTQHLVDWTARVALQKIYKPGSAQFKKAKREFLTLK